MMFMDKPITDMSFREAMEELNSIVSKLESNTLELEEILQVYERGIALLADLQKRITNAQQKVDVLMGELSEKVDDSTQDTTLS